MVTRFQTAVLPEIKRKSRFSELAFGVKECIQNPAQRYQHKEYEDRCVCCAKYPTVDTIIACEKLLIITRPIRKEYNDELSDDCNHWWDYSIQTNVVRAGIGHDVDAKVVVGEEQNFFLPEIIESEKFESLCLLSEEIADTIAEAGNIAGGGTLRTVSHEPIFDETALKTHNMFVSTITSVYSACHERRTK